MEDIVKQVIVMRKDLGMRKGKQIAQGAHASIAWLTNRMHIEGAHIRNAMYTPILTIRGITPFVRDNTYDKYAEVNLKLSEEEVLWIAGKFTKVCVSVDSEIELDQIAEAAMKAGLTVDVIVDSGKTEFNGVPTKTCLAIGPHRASKIDPITGHLKLL